MFVFATQAASDAGVGADIAFWCGRLAVLLLIVVAIRKYVFKKSSTSVNLGRRDRKRAPQATAAAVTAPTPAGPAAAAPGASVTPGQHLPPAPDILPR